MEFISIKDFDDDNWQKYFEMSQEILRRHYPHMYKPGRLFDDFKKRTINNTESDSTYNLYMVTNDLNPSAWFDACVWSNDLYFGFDVVDDEVKPDLLNSVFYKLNEQIRRDAITNSVISTYRKAVYSSLLGVTENAHEELIISRLERIEMNRSYYDLIANNNSLNEFKLERFGIVLESLLESFVNCVNRCFDDMERLNPAKKNTQPLTSVEWVKDKAIQRNNGTTLDILVLLDKENEVAGTCWVCKDEYRKETIRHNGGLTAVMPKYRGLGIAKYLKAKMYLNLLEENKDFKYITTDTMPWNSYMFKINEEFGFRPFKKGYSFKITGEFIENYLKSN